METFLMLEYKIIIYTFLSFSIHITAQEQNQSRSRKSITENNKNNNHIYEDIDKYRHPPPNITPVSGVPNLKVGWKIKKKLYDKHFIANL